MTVYVDELKVWTDRGLFAKGSCHLTADTLDELHELAARIGMKRSWFQDGHVPHYDLVASRRERAVKAGAVFVPAREQAMKRIEARRLAARTG